MNFLTFLNSSILFVAFAAGIPILIHLFAKKKTKKIYFSSIKFIKEIQNSNKKKILIKNFLLLLTRILVILFFVLAIAKPALKLKFYKSKNHQPTAIAIILDNSYSMNYLIDNETDFEKAKNKILKLNEVLNEKDVHILITRNKKHFVKKYGKINESDVRELSLAESSKDLTKLLRTAENELKKVQLVNKEIYFFTDLQKEKFDFESNYPVYFISSHEKKKIEKFNLSCQNARVENDWISKSFKKQVSFVVKNHSQVDQKDILCKLYINGKTVSEKVVNVAKNSKEEFSFKFEFSKSGWYNGFVEIADERYLFDNKNYFSYYHIKEPKIALLSDSKTIPVPLKSIFEIFTKDSDNLEIVDQNSLSEETIAKYSNFILYKKNHFSKAFKRNLRNINEKSGFLHILNEKMSVDERNFCSEFYGISVDSLYEEKALVKDINFYNPLLAIFQDKQDYEVSNFWKIEPKKNDVLINSSISPILIGKDSSFLLSIVPEKINNPFWAESLAPVSIFRILQNISDSNKNYNVDLNSKINIPAQNIKEIYSKKEYYLNDNKFVPEKSGIYSYKDDSKFFSVNLNYEESNFEKQKDIPKDIKLLEDRRWKNQIFKARSHFELYKPFLFLSLFMMICELLLILYYRD